MALAKGKSRVKCGPITLHTETAIYIASQLTEVCVFLHVDVTTYRKQNLSS